MTLERTVGAAVIRDAGIGGHARAGEDEGGTLAEQFGSALEGMSRWGGLGGFRNDALDGADGRTVSHLHGFGEARIAGAVGVRHQSPLCIMEVETTFHTPCRFVLRTGERYWDDQVAALTSSRHNLTGVNAAKRGAG